MNLFCFLCTSAEELLWLPHTEWSLRYNWKRREKKEYRKRAEMVTWCKGKTLCACWRTSASFPKIQKYCILAITNVRFLQIYKKIPEYTFVGPRYSTVCDNHNQALITFRHNYLEWLANPSNSFLARSTIGVTLAMHPGTPRRRKGSYILTSSFMLVRNKTIIFMQEQDEPGSFIYSGPMWNRVAYRPFALLYVVFLPFCGSSCLVNSFTVSWSFLSTTSPNTAIQCLEKSNHSFSPLVQLQPIIIKCNL